MLKSIQYEKKIEKKYVQHTGDKEQFVIPGPSVFTRETAVLLWLLTDAK